MNSIEDLEHILLPGNTSRELRDNILNSPRLQQYNQFYEDWKTSWNQTYKELKSESSAQPNDFLRQDILAGLFFENEPIALQTYAIFDLRWSAHRDHSYLSPFPSKYLDSLHHQNLNRLWTVQFLFVKPEWRKNLQQVSVSEVLAILGIRAFYASQADIMIGVARADRKINEMLYRRGASVIQRGLTLHNVAIDLLKFDRNDQLILKTDRPEDEYIEKFWNDRIDFSDLQPALNSAAIFQELSSA